MITCYKKVRFRWESEWNRDHCWSRAVWNLLWDLLRSVNFIEKICDLDLTFNNIKKYIICTLYGPLIFESMIGISRIRKKGRYLIFEIQEKLILSYFRFFFNFSIEKNKYCFEDFKILEEINYNFIAGKFIIK